MVVLILPALVLVALVVAVFARARQAREELAALRLEVAHLAGLEQAARRAAQDLSDVAGGLRARLGARGGRPGRLPAP